MKPDLPGERPKFSSSSVLRYFRGAFKSNNGLRIAVWNELIGPDARMALVIPSETRSASLEMRFSMNAFYVVGTASIALSINTELIFTTG